ncbi:inosine-uridine preferring nucleoside hydrolase [Anaeramoeba flamelloides]|uniref:Inosine-uridine preferring nucleoside hydrolase n=1 Tax=Anaeramoeba flamelloides TaxID=1746091 RepID=A0ABQ8XSY5_9EUKA|nr:inosine-uridine preferring nucleoside hydrolase [Anaeramoeba flamelloides]
MNTSEKKKNEQDNEKEKEKEKEKDKEKEKEKEIQKVSTEFNLKKVERITKKKFEELKEKTLKYDEEFPNKNFKSFVKVPDYDEEQRPIPVIFDTDIGSDIDDALALLLLLHLPAEDVKLLGVTTEYGWVGVRAAVAESIVENYRKDYEVKEEIPVYAGYTPVLYNKMSLWHTGNEGYGAYLNEKQIKKLIKEPYTFKQNKNSKWAAVDFIIKCCLESEKKISIISIGGMTNIALALRKNPLIIKNIDRIVFMGMAIVPHSTKMPDILKLGHSYHCNHSCHNIRQDIGAAMEVFNSGVRIMCVGHAVTHTWFNNEIVPKLRKMDSKYGDFNVVGLLLDIWLHYRSQIFHQEIDGTCPHDPLTTTECIYPSRFIKYARGYMRITPKGNSEFIWDPVNGNHYIGSQFRHPKIWLKWFSYSLLSKEQNIKQNIILKKELKKIKDNEQKKIDEML